MTTSQIIEIVGVLCGPAKTLSNESHACDSAAGGLIIVLAAKTDHSFDTIGIGLQRFGGMAMFTRFSKLFEKVFAAAMFIGSEPRVRQQSFRQRQPNKKLGR